MAPRRSPRLHPQIHPSQEGAGTARRRSPRLHPQIQASQEEGAGLARRRGPQVHSSEEGSSEEGAGMARRAGTSPEAADASLPDADDLLREILLRLPPQPSSLPRASAVCRRWRALVTDPKFHRQFCAHHRKPPLLGFFHISDQATVLTSVLDPPDCIPPQRFDLGHKYLLDCRHGLVLCEGDNQKEVFVCDLITCVQRRVAIPSELRNSDFLEGAVLCAAAAADHVHSSCHSSPFKVVLVSMNKHDCRPLTCVYSSETGLWGNLISAEAQCLISSNPAVLVGNCLYWLSLFDGMLEFDLDENNLTVIGVPLVPNHTKNCQIIEAENGVVGFAELSYPRFQLWQRNVNAHGVTTWVPWKTIEMHSIPGLPSRIEGKIALLLGYDEDTDVIFLHATGNVYEVQLKLMQSKKLNETYHVNYYRPFKSFYTPGTAITGG